MRKYSCEKCAKTFSQKSHYDKHITRKIFCEIQTDKIKALIYKTVEEKIIELNKKLILNNTKSNIINNTLKMELSKKELLIECDKLGITKCKSKRKYEIIKLINAKNNNYINDSTNVLIKNTDISSFIHTTNISPLRYPGGKSRACKIIDAVILQHFDITCFDTIISPFFGGGSFEFYLQNKYGLDLIVNDKFTPLYNFWKQVKLNKTILCEELRKIKSVSKEQFIDYRNTIMNLNDNILQQSIQYFIINRCSFSGNSKLDISL